MPISHNSAITSSCLVPAGTSDLSCCETLSVADRTSGAFTRGILQSKTSESDQDGDVSLDEEEITEIQTTPPRQHTIYRFQVDMCYKVEEMVLRYFLCNLWAVLCNL